MGTSFENDDLARMVCQMQALVRGTLVRRSFLRTRREYEDLACSLGGMGLKDQGSQTIALEWPSSSLCYPCFKSESKGPETDVLQRLAKRQWRKPHTREQQPVSATLLSSPQQESQPLLPTRQEATNNVAAMSHQLQPGSETHFQTRLIKEDDTGQPFESNKQTITCQGVGSPGGVVPLPGEGEVERGTLEEDGRSSDQPAHCHNEADASDGSGRADTDQSETNVHFEELGDQVKGQSVGGDGTGVEAQRLDETDLTLVSSIASSSVNLSHSEEDDEDNDDAVRQKVNNDLSSDPVMKVPDACVTSELACTKPLDTYSDGNPADSSDHSPSPSTLHSLTETSLSSSSDHHSNHRAPEGQNEREASGVNLCPDADLPAAASTPSCDGVAMATGSQRLRLAPSSDEAPRSNEMKLEETRGGESRSIESSGGCSSKSTDADQFRLVTTCSNGAAQSGNGDSIRQSHDASVAADMTSVWSLDQTDLDEDEQSNHDPDEDGNHGDSRPHLDTERLRELRSSTAMELLWIQQAIESRKNYLRLKSKMGCREGSTSEEQDGMQGRELE